MVLLYRLFGFLYLASGFWCVFKLEVVASFLGFEFLTEMGRSEFFSVYGGLQIGLGIAMLLSSFKTIYLEGGIYFSAIFSSVLALFRIFSFLVFGFIEGFVFMLVLEIFIAASLWGVWFTLKK